MTQNVRNEHKEDVEILFNLMNTQGTSIGNVQIPYATHGQDLSIQQTGIREFTAYTTGKGRKGVAQFSMDLNDIDLSGTNQKLAINFMGTTHTKLGGTTPTLSSSKQYMLVYSGGKINIYHHGTTSLVRSIPLESKLLNIPFQGIAMYDGVIYTIHGDHIPANKKYLSRYNFNTATHIETTDITPKDKKLISNWEVEGLVFVNSVLYTSLNIDYKDGDTKKYFIKTSKL
jgi:hypothetical protein